MSVDDPLQEIDCRILSWKVCEDGHVEYVLNCKRFSSNKTEWTVLRRYKQFYKLNKQLSSFGIDLSLPTKKYIGNTDSHFLEERKKKLQNFIDVVISHPLLQCSLHVADFLEYPECSTNETQQWLLIAIRNRKEFIYKRSWDNVSWRYFKTYALLESPNVRQNYVLSFMPYGPDAISESDSKLVLDFLSTLDCPYLCLSVHSWTDAKGVGVIRPLLQNGVLRDLLHKQKPEGSFLKKYGMNAECYSLSFGDILFIARQALEMFYIFHSISIPFIEIHCGNVRIAELGCEILDYEFVVAGQSNINRLAMICCSKVETIEDMMIFNFGYFLYEMLTGLMVFPEHEPQLVLNQISEPFHSLLRSIFAPAQKMPTLVELMAQSIFNEVSFTRLEQSEIRIPTKVKEILQHLCTQKVTRLIEERKMYQLRTKVEAVQKLLTTEKRNNSSSFIKVFR